MISNDLRNVTDVKLKELERFQVADGTQCGDKVVYAGGTFGLAGLIAGAAHGAYPALWPKVVIRGPRIMMTFYLMGRHSVTWGNHLIVIRLLFVCTQRDLFRFGGWGVRARSVSDSEVPRQRGCD